MECHIQQLERYKMGQSECGKSTHKKEIKRLLKLNYAKKIKYLKKNFVVSNKSTQQLFKQHKIGKNTLNNNKENFTISNTTKEMLLLLRDFAKLQERAIALYEDKTEGENVIDATVAMMHSMQDAIAVNIGATLNETRYCSI